MKKLDMYVLKEMVIPLIAGTVIILLLFISNEMIYAFKTYNLKSVPVDAILKLAILSGPKWFLLVFPMGVTFGSSLAISRLSREGEITAMRAAGFSFWRIMRIVGIVGLVFAGLSYVSSDRVAPKAMQEYRKMLLDIGIAANVGRIEQNQSISLPPYSANIGSVQQDGDDLILKDILLFERSQPGQVTIYTAPTGTYVAGIWTIEKPEIRIIEGENLIMVNRAPQLVINQPIVLSDFVSMPLEKERSNRELWEDIEKSRVAKLNTRVDETEFYGRFAGAATCFGFALMGGILAFRFRRGSAFQGFLISLISVWMYFNAQIIATEALGQFGWVQPMIAAWIPFGLIAVTTLAFMWRLE